MKSPAQIILALLITVKLVLGSFFIYRSGFNPFWGQTDAIAAESSADISADAIVSLPVVEKENTDLVYIQKRTAELKAQEEKLARKEAELLMIQEELNTKITELTRLRNEIRAKFASKKAANDRKLKHLIKAFSAMKPQSAASLIEKLDRKLAIKLLSKMKGDVVGQILSNIEIEKAARISEGLLLRE